MAMRAAWSALGVVCLMTASSPAQTAQYIGYSLPITGTNTVQVQSIVIDSSGDVFVSDSGNDQVVELKPATGGGYQTQVTVASASVGSLGSPRGLALDTSGNLYIADYGSNQILNVQCTAGTCTTPHQFIATTGSPIDLVYDPIDSTSNNEYLWFTVAGSGNVYQAAADCGQSSCSSVEAQTAVIAGAGTQPYGLAFQSTSGTAGKLFVSDNSAGTVLEEAYSSGTYTPTTLVSSGLSAPAGMAVDAANNSLFIADSGNNRVAEVPIAGGSLSTAVGGLDAPLGVTFDGSGTHYIANSQYALKSSAANFGEVLAGSTSSSIRLWFNIITSGTGSKAVLTQGASEPDFADKGTGTCSGTFTAGSTCSIDATFKPSYPGARYGAATLVGGGSTIATGYLYGVGTGPQIAFAPASNAGAPLSETTFDGTGVNSNTPNGIAVDAAGNIYLSETSSGKVVRLAPNTYTQTPVASGLAYPNGVAVDGAGNVYIADSGCQLADNTCQGNSASGQLYFVPWNGASYGAKQALLAANTHAPAGVAVDANGDVFFTEGRLLGSPYVGEIPLGGSLTQLTQFTGSHFKTPSGLAFDASGNLFVTDSQWASAAGGAPVWELASTASGWSVNATAAIASIPAINSNPSVPSGIVLDANQDIYIADFNQHAVYKFPWTGSNWGSQATVPTSTLDTTAGLALDGSGNLYVTECNCDLTYPTSNHPRAFEEVYAKAPTLTFANTDVLSGKSSDSPQTVTVSNIGNSQLTFSDTFSDPNFALAGGSTCTSPQTLTAGTNSCALAFNFAPTITGLDTYGLQLTDNNLNVANTTHTITLNGTGTGVAAIQVTTPGTVTAGQAFVITIKALDSNSNVVTSYNGTVDLVSTDGLITPASYTLLNGQASLFVTVYKAESQTIAATDSVHSYITGHSTAFTVNPGPLNQLVLGTPVGAPPELAGTSFTMTVTAEDAYGNKETGNSDTISFTSTDPHAVLPAASPLTSGTGNFSFTLKTEGAQTITASDAANHLSITSPAITVDPGPATTLAAISGTPQFTLVNQAFPMALTVKLTDAYGNAINGTLVSFAPPGSGASAMLSSSSCTTGSGVNPAGSCSVTATANSIANPNPNTPYTVTASTASPALSVGFSLTNVAMAVNPFGSAAAVGTTSSAKPVAVVFTTGGTLNSINVLTGGVPSLDFASVTGGTCTIGTTYSAGQSCTVDVTFTPKYAGERFGAVVLRDGNNVVLGTEYLDPLGEGPQIVYEPGQQSTLAVIGAATPVPTALAVDGAGDVFVSDASTNQQVMELVRQNNGYTHLSVASGFTGVNGIALDGANNAYIADTTAKQLYKVTWNGVAYGTPQPLLAAATYSPAGVAIDAAGNVYFTSSTGSDGNVYEILATNEISNASTVTTLAAIPGVGHQAAGLAFDSSGDLFVSDSVGNQIYELIWSGTSYITPGISLALTGLTAPEGIALDAASNLYIANSGAGSNVVKALFNGSSWNTPVTENVSTQLSPATLNGPRAVALDQAGNIYVADTGNKRVIKDDRADAPTLNFATTELYGTSSDSPQTVTVENVGNQTLQFTASGVSFATDFPVGTAPASPNQACVHSLSLSATTPPLPSLQSSFCQLVIDFIPTQSGNPVSYSEDLVLTDNNLEVSNATQSIHLTGESFPQLYLKPNTVSFGNQPQGSTSNTWTMTLENEGNAQITDIDLQFINLTGENDDNSSSFAPSPNPFSIVSNTCGWSQGHPFTLNSYQDCTILVAFTPQLTGHSADSYTAQLEVTDSASANPPLNPVLASFSGTGSGDPVFLSPNSITFANQTAGSTGNPWTVTFNNVSSASINITKIAITGLDATDFSYTTDCGATVGPNTNCRLFVTFNPAASATTGVPLTATLQVTSSGSPTPLALSLTGTANPLSATLAPNNLNFGSQAQGTQSSDSIATLTNNGDGALDVSSFSITSGGGSFKIDSGATTCTTSLPAHGTCKIAVYFYPSNTTSGQVNGTLTVVDGAGTHTTSLVGIATSGSSSIAFSPSSVNFGNQTVGSSTGPTTVKLTNSGSSSVTVTYGPNTGDSGDFSFVPSGYPAACGTTLASGSSCSFEVIFSPTTTGTRSATFALSYAGCGGSCTSALTLNGTGTAPTATLAPSSLNFGTVADGASSTPDQLLTVTNTSAGPVTLHSITIPSPFVWDSGSISNTCILTHSLPGGGSCQIAVYFHPTTAGNKSATASVNLTYTGGSLTLTSGLSGVGAAPDVSFSTNSLAFGNVTVGSSSTLSLVVTNSGGAPISLSGAPGLSGPGAPLYTISNTGTCWNSVTSLAAGGSSGDSCTIVVRYTPTAVGAAGTPTTVSLAFAGPLALSASLTGNGVAPAVVVSPNPVNYGNITIGVTSPTLTATVTNNSDVAVTVTGVNALTAPFTPVGAPAGGTCYGSPTLSPSHSCTLTYTFRPTTVGNATQVVTVDLSAGSHSLPPITATFTGAGVLATGTLSPSSLTFGDVFVNLSTALQVTITNTSGTALTVGAITPASGVFAASSNCDGHVLAADGGQCTLSVTFAPTSPGNANGTLNVPLTYPCTPGPTCSINLTAALFGQGDAPSISVSPSSLNFGNVVYQTGPTVAQKVTIMNTASGPVKFSSIAINPNVAPDGFNITNNTCPAILNAGVSCNLYIDFNPQIVASYSAQLVLSDNAIGSPQMVSLSGAGVNKTTPSMSVSCVPNPITYAQSAVCTAFLSSGTGTVAFTARVHGSGPYSISLGSGTVSGGSAVSPSAFATLAPGTYDVQAEYNGDSKNTTAIAVTTETINAITPTISLSCSPGSLPYGDPSVCTASVGSGAPNGSTVTFYWQQQGASSFTYLSSGTLAGGSATAAIVGGSPFTAGHYTIEAVYAGATGYASGETATASLTVNQIVPAIVILPTPAGPINTGEPVGSVPLTGGCATAPGYSCPGPPTLAGSFIWTNPTDEFSSSGNHSESVTFVPTDSTDYASVTGIISFNVPHSNMVIGGGSYSLLASPPSLTLAAGQSGTVNLTMLPSGGYTGTVSLSCAGLPSGISCSFAPSTLTADGKGNAETSVLTITTVGFSASTGGANERGGRALAGLFLLPGLLCGGFLAWRRKKLGPWARHLLVLAAVASVLAGLNGCGGQGGSFANTLTGTHTLTISAQATASANSSTATTQTGTFTLTITQ
jgi:sugar lactone lactonase YvrE